VARQLLLLEHPEEVAGVVREGELGVVENVIVDFIKLDGNCVHVERLTELFMGYDLGCLGNGVFDPGDLRVNQSALGHQGIGAHKLVREPPELERYPL
jgi:hypothetical protein